MYRLFTDVLYTEAGVISPHEVRLRRHVGHGQPPPPELKDAVESKTPVELSGEEFFRLSEDHDVAIMHYRQVQPTRKERLAGAAPRPDLLVLMLDSKGGKFRQR